MAFTENPFTNPIFFMIWILPPLILQILFNYYYKKEKGFTTKNVVYLVVGLIWLLTPMFLVFVAIMALALK
jgi:hypothetical protein